MNMHGPEFLEAVVSLVEEGKLEESRIDYACEKMKFELGLFENAQVDLIEVDRICS